MQDAGQIYRRKRRSNRSVLAGVVLMATAMVVSITELAPPLVTTVGAVIGFMLLMYGVHVAWVVFYDREDDGPPS